MTGSSASDSDLSRGGLKTGASGTPVAEAGSAGSTPGAPNADEPKIGTAPKDDWRSNWRRKIVSNSLNLD